MTDVFSFIRIMQLEFTVKSFIPESIWKYARLYGVLTYMRCTKIRILPKIFIDWRCASFKNKRSIWSARLIEWYLVNATAHCFSHKMLDCCNFVTNIFKPSKEKSLYFTKININRSHSIKYCVEVWFRKFALKPLPRLLLVERTREGEKTSGQTEDGSGTAEPYVGKTQLCCLGLSSWEFNPF